VNSKPNSSSEAQAARLDRQRRAAEEGAKAMKEAAEKAVHIRENMARLRQLRLAKEAADFRLQRDNARASPKSSKAKR
jgi:hypothetical protein